MSINYSKLRENAVTLEAISVAWANYRDWDNYKHNIYLKAYVKNVIIQDNVIS